MGAKLVSKEFMKDYRRCETSKQFFWRVCFDNCLAFALSHFIEKKYSNIFP